MLAARTFRGRVINSIVPTTLRNGNVVLAATAESNGGVWRSTDDGVSFKRISGTAELPGGGVSSLVADPTNPKFFYAALPSSTIANAGDEGVYLSMDGGLKWTHTSLAGVTGSTRILLAVSQGTGAVYAMVMNGGTLKDVSRSGDHGTTWDSMGVPTPPIFPGGQTNTNGAIAADPADGNVVFIAGDRQDGPPFPNSNGCTNFTANVFRGDASLLPANPWECVVCSGAQASSPHADSRALVFDTSGDLMLGCDGGIYRLLSPNAAPVRDPDGGTAYVLYRRDRIECSKGASLLKSYKIRESSVTNRVVATCCNSAMFMNFDKGPHWVSAYRTTSSNEDFIIVSSCSFTTDSFQKYPWRSCTHSK